MSSIGFRVWADLISDGTSFFQYIRDSKTTLLKKVLCAVFNK